MTLGDSGYECSGYPRDTTSLQLEFLMEGQEEVKTPACPNETFSLSPSSGVKGQKGNAGTAAPTAGEEDSQGPNY